MDKRSILYLLTALVFALFLSLFGISTVENYMSLGTAAPVFDAVNKFEQSLASKDNKKIETAASDSIKEIKDTKTNNRNINNILNNAKYTDVDKMIKIMGLHLNA
jgi:hypothetical protein